MQSAWNAPQIFWGSKKNFFRPRRSYRKGKNENQKKFFYIKDFCLQKYTEYGTMYG